MVMTVFDARILRHNTKINKRYIELSGIVRRVNESIVSDAWFPIVL